MREAYGFVNARALTQEPGSDDVLRIWRAAGHPLANHASSHVDLHATSVEAFAQDVLASEPTLRTFMGDRGWRWFRFPYLREGEMLPRLFDLLREQGIAVISLEEAQAGRAYESVPRRPGPRGGTFLGQLEEPPPQRPAGGATSLRD